MPRIDDASIRGIYRDKNIIDEMPRIDDVSIRGIYRDKNISG